MSLSRHLTRSLAMSAAAVLATWCLGALPATADKGGNGHGVGQSQAQQDKKEPKGGDTNNGSNGNHGDGNNGSNGNHGDGNNGNGGGGGNGRDPAGNNGTVKITQLGENDGTPNNDPHPGCAFQVEWYGFDEGADIISTVSFAMQAPTQDVALSVAGDTSVFVGGDPASGAGTDTGLDGVETYTLSFDGAPHPQQGYHVKVTVHTPQSQGNDSKTKVFWVEPCATTPEADTSDDATTGTRDDTEVAGAQASAPVEVRGTQASAPAEVRGTQASAPAEVMGEQAYAPAVASATAQDDALVPTAVDAGEDGNPVLDWVSSPLALVATGLGVLLGFGALLARRRSSGSIDS